MLTITVAILAQGTSWAVAVTQAFCAWVRPQLLPLWQATRRSQCSGPNNFASEQLPEGIQNLQRLAWRTSAKFHLTKKIFKA